MCALLSLAAALTLVALSMYPSPKGRANAATDVPGTLTLQAQPASSGVTVSYPTQVPNGYGAPTGLVADPNGDGVWFFAESDHEITVFHFRQSTDSITSIPLEVSPQLAAGYVTPMVSDTAGNIWIGIDATLVQVSTSTDSVNYITLPAPPLVSSSVVHLPRAIPGVPETAFADIDSLATMPNGSILIGRMFSSVLQIYNPASTDFSSIALPQDTVIEGTGSDLAVTAAGEIDTILLNGTGGPQILEQFDNETWVPWAPTDSGCDPESVIAAGGQLLVVGASCIFEGPTSTIESAPTAVSEVALDQSALGGATLTAVGLPLSTSETILGTSSGCILTGTSGETAIPLGTVTEPASNIGGFSGDLVVPVTLGFVSGAHQDGVWFTNGRGGSQIGLLSLSQ